MTSDISIWYLHKIFVSLCNFKQNLTFIQNNYYLQRHSSNWVCEVHLCSFPSCRKTLPFPYHLIRRYFLPDTPYLPVKYERTLKEQYLVLSGIHLRQSGTNLLVSKWRHIMRRTIEIYEILSEIEKNISPRWKEIWLVLNLSKIC